MATGTYGVAREGRKGEGGGFAHGSAQRREGGGGTYPRTLGVGGVEPEAEYQSILSKLKVRVFSYFFLFKLNAVRLFFSLSFLEQTSR